jgi:hypothetical protein
MHWKVEQTEHRPSAQKQKMEETPAVVGGLCTEAGDGVGDPTVVGALGTEAGDGAGGFGWPSTIGLEGDWTGADGKLGADGKVGLLGEGVPGK